MEKWGVWEAKKQVAKSEPAEYAKSPKAENTRRKGALKKLLMKYLEILLKKDKCIPPKKVKKSMTQIF